MKKSEADRDASSHVPVSRISVSRWRAWKYLVCVRRVRSWRVVDLASCYSGDISRFGFPEITNGPWNRENGMWKIREKHAEVSSPQERKLPCTLIGRDLICSARYGMHDWNAENQKLNFAHVANFQVIHHKTIGALFSWDGKRKRYRYEMFPMPCIIFIFVI